MCIVAVGRIGHLQVVSSFAYYDILKKIVIIDKKKDSYYNIVI